MSTTTVYKVPEFLIGKGVTYVSIIPGFINTDGFLVTDTEQTLVGKWKNIQINIEPNMVNIKSADMGTANHVDLYEDNSITVTELLAYHDDDTVPKNICAYFAVFYGIGIFTVTRGGMTWQFIGKRGRYTEDLEEGESTGALELKIIGVIDTTLTPPAFIGNPFYFKPAP